MSEMTEPLYKPEDQFKKDYTIIELLSDKGGFGETYLVRRTASSTGSTLVRVLKIFRESSVAAKQLERETEVYLQFTHPNIIQCYRIFSNPPSLILEYAENGDLEKYVFQQPNKRLTEREALELTKQIQSALNELHSRRRFHQDIKPSNIFLSTTYTAKLGDFGLSRILELKGLAEVSAATFTYAAPEVLSGRRADYRSDIFSLGLTFYFMVTGHHARVADQHLDTKHIKYFEPLLGATEYLDSDRSTKTFSMTPDPRNFVPLSEETMEWLRACLVEDPNERTERIDHLDELLGAALQSARVDRFSGLSEEGEAMHWLSNTAANNFITNREPRADYSKVLPNIRALQDVSYCRLPLHYEPRSLSVGPEGRVVAVGTKAGKVLIASRSLPKDNRGPRWNSQLEDPQVESILTEPIDQNRQAIRGVCFLPNGSVVAGWGAGNFAVLRASQSESLDSSVEAVRWEIAAPQQSESRTAGKQSLRFKELVPVSDFGANRDHISTVALGITRHGHGVHVLEDVPGRGLRSRADVLPGNLLAWEKLAFSQRITSACWCNQRLWLLTAGGTLWRCTVADGQISLDGYSFELRKHRPDTRILFRKIAGCVSGLAVLAGDYVTFLRLTYNQSDQSSAPCVDKARQIRWRLVPRALSITVCVPYYDSDQQCSEELTKSNPAWVVVTTEGDGVVWIRWTDTNKQWPWASYFSGIGTRFPLYAEFGFGGQSGATFLACASREHVVEIATIVDRESGEAQLKNTLPKLARNVPALRLPQSARWLLLLRTLRLGHLNQSDAWISSWLQGVDFEQLRSLPGPLVEAYKTAKETGEDRGSVSVLRLLTRWWLAVLRRAGRESQAWAVRLTRELSLIIEGSAATRPDPELEVFGDFLRKWIIHGQSYFKKEMNLGELYAFNYKSRRGLDASIYLSRLFSERLDLIARVSLRESATQTAGGVSTWHMTRSEDLKFFALSLTDGSVGLMSSTGRPVRWNTDPVADRLSLLGLHKTSDGTGIGLKPVGNQARSKSLFPRRLGVISLREQGHALLVPFKANIGDLKRSESKSAIYVLHGRLVSGDEFRVSSIDRKVLEGEIYGVAFFEGLAPEGASSTSTSRKLTAMLGTQGHWPSNERGSWIPSPFIALEINLESDGAISFGEAQFPEVETGARRQRSLIKRSSTIPDSAYNPCWALAHYPYKGNIYLFASFNDGSIRAFRSENGLDLASWHETGFRADSSSLPSSTDYSSDSCFRSLGSPVWLLQLVDQLSDREPLLAFSTGGGQVGALPLGQVLEEKSSSGSYVILDDLGAPVSCLDTYEDEHQIRLVAISQSGSVAIYSLENSSLGRARNASLGAIRGERSDHFKLSLGVMAGAFTGYSYARDGREIVKIPRIMIGTDQGTVDTCLLTAPKGSVRRRRLSKGFFECLGSVFSGTGTDSNDAERIIEESPREWLAVLCAGNTSLIRLAYWLELRMIGRKFQESSETTVFHQAKISRNLRLYITTLEKLSLEALTVHYPSRAAAKMIWSEAGSFGSKLIERALESGTSTEDRRVLFESAIECLDIALRLCRHWGNTDGDSEAKALVHMMMSCFGWQHIVLQCLSEELVAAQDFQVSAAINRLRWRLFREILRPRLNHADWLVPLETLRVLNAALARATIAMLDSGQLICDSRDLILRASPTEGMLLDDEVSLRESEDIRVSFFNVALMVGDLWARCGDSEVFNQAVSMEAARFFGSVLVLMPGASLLIAQIISESGLPGLMTHQSALVVARQARQTLANLPAEDPFTSEPYSSSTRQGIHLFELFYSARLDESTTESGAATELIAQAIFEPNIAPTTENHRFMVEQCAILLVGKSLFDLQFTGTLLVETHLDGISRLYKASAPPLASQQVRNLVEDILAEEAVDSWYFTHSCALLSKLVPFARSVRRSIDEGAVRTGLASTRAAQHLILSSELFEPQTSQYLSIVENWLSLLVASRSRNGQK